MERSKIMKDVADGTHEAPAALADVPRHEVSRLWNGDRTVVSCIPEPFVECLYLYLRRVSHRSLRRDLVHHLFRNRHGSSRACERLIET